jgi:aspartyl-tRNA(Asn)/glutamyl-tRNA(Gln) amidotransferase subunit A
LSSFFPLMIAAAAAFAADIDVVELTIRQAAADMNAKKYTSRQLAQAFLDRIQQYNAGYNAIITMNPDVLKDADRIDRLRASGEQVGPLAGIPVVVKDTMDMKGLPSTGGWKNLSAKAGGVEILPDSDSAVVARMRKAGAVILGKTNVPIMSMSGTNTNNSWAGPTYNAASTKHAPGGSSAGTAMAVSGSLAVAGLAEETGGSIQNPAAAQGIVAIKPTFALVPNTGVIPLAGSTRDTVGPHAKTVHDAALMFDVLAGFASEDPKTTAAIGKIPKGGYTAKLTPYALLGKRIGLYGPGWRKGDELTPETKILYDTAINQMQALGATMIADPFAGSGFADIYKPALRGTFDSRGYEYLPFDFLNYLKRMGKDAPQTIDEFTARAGEGMFDAEGMFTQRFAGTPGYDDCRADPATPPDMTPFLEIRNTYNDIFNQVTNAYNLDALCFPQMFKETPPIFGTETIGATTVSEINIGGFPGIVVPAGYYASGAPFALIFVGKLWDEGELLGMAYAYEQASKARKIPELVEKPSAE